MSNFLPLSSTISGTHFSVNICPHLLFFCISSWHSPRNPCFFDRFCLFFTTKSLLYFSIVFPPIPRIVWGSAERKDLRSWVVCLTVSQKPAKTRMSGWLQFEQKGMASVLVSVPQQEFLFCFQLFGRKAVRQFQFPVLVHSVCYPPYKS